MLDRSGGEILIDQLRIHGVDRVFCVPGESYLAVLDALYGARHQIALVVCRHEGGAAYMAEAYGKLTGKPGICFVTRGPGAANASVAIHTAFQDSTPLVLFVGQVARDQTEREAFQEVDYRRFFGQMTKWVAQIDNATRIPELVSQAFHRAVNGRPGPVALALPEDMLLEHVIVPDAAPYRRSVPGANPVDIAEMTELLLRAERPLVILGGSDWTADAREEIRQFSETWRLPVAASFRRQDLFDNTHPNYVGLLGIAPSSQLIEAVKTSDVLLVIGARLSEITTRGYTLVDIPVPHQALIHIYPGAEELGRVYRASLPINAGVTAFAREAAALPPPETPRWTPWRDSLHANYRAELKHRPNPGAVQMGEIMTWLRGHLPADAIVTTGAGNYSIWPQRYYQYRRFRTCLGPTNGSMGYGTPAAIAAKLIEPARTVVAFAGDGCFLMNGQELATAVQYRANIIVLVINNGMYGTIRMHQERAYPGRVIGTELVNPDFAALARAFGAHGEIVIATADFAGAFRRAEASGKPAVIEVRVDPEVLTPTTTLSEFGALTENSMNDLK